MAVYNEIGIGRWNRFIQKLTDIKGSPPARQLASEIVFQHPIFHGQENRYLESWDRFGIGLTIGPIAAQQSGFRITNPTGSNVIVVLEKACIAYTSSGSALVNFEYSNAAALLSNPAASIPMETRGRTSSTALLSFNAAALSTLNVVSQVSVLSGVTYDFIQDTIQEVSLPPGASAQMDSNGTNIAVTFTFWWRERFLEPAERK
jgi:hypothetical protein